MAKLPFHSSVSNLVFITLIMRLIESSAV